MPIRRALRYLGWTLEELGKEMCTSVDLRPRGGRNDAMVLPKAAVWRRMVVLAIDEITRRLRIYKEKNADEIDWIPYRKAARRCRVKWQKVYALCSEDKIPTQKTQTPKRKRYKNLTSSP